MKNIIKKISAVAMALAMLATGTALSSNDELTVHAACNHYNCRRYFATCSGSWETYNSKITSVVETSTYIKTTTTYYQRRNISNIYCSNCGNAVTSYYEYRTTPSTKTVKKKNSEPKLFNLT
ncbi:MAG: hypothetical protein E7505_07595 [Ruminococcus sp.]|nr:hypothetical protein [Ruminococcus sp.]